MGRRLPPARRVCLVEPLEQRRMLTVEISVNDIQVDEDAGTAQFTVSLSESSSSTITVDAATSNGTARTVDGDYTSKSVSLLFTPGNTTLTVDVTIADDTDKESDETFKLDLSNASGGTIVDSQGLAFIIDDDATGQTNRLDSFQKSGGTAEHAGNVSLSFQLSCGVELLYNTLSAAQPIIAVETVQPEDSDVPDEIKAELTFDGTTGDAVYYDTTGLDAGDPLRFVLQADASSLESGTYDWSLKLTETHGSDISTRTFTRVASIANTSDSPFGEFWSVKGLNHLAIDDDWATVVFSHGGAMPYAREEGGGGDPPPPGGGGGGSGDVLVENQDGSWTYHYRLGGTAEYDADGVLQELVDRNDNVTSFTYDTNGRLTSITDAFGREVTFSYSSGLLEEIEGFAGDVTSFTHDASGRLTSITLPDPDRAGSLTSPVTEFTVDATTGLMTEMEDALGNTVSFDYDFAGRLETKTFDDSTTNEYEPVIVQGLVDLSVSGTPSNPADLFAPSDAVATFTDALGNETKYELDWLGYPLKITDAEENEFTFERNEYGEPTKMTIPDPDGSGPLGDLVTEYEWSESHNLTKMILPGSTELNPIERTWQYDATFNQVTKTTDELGRITTYGIDATHGNITSMILAG